MADLALPSGRQLLGDHAAGSCFTRIITGSFDGTVRIWKADVDLDALKAAAHARVFRSLTDDERRAHRRDHLLSDQ